MIGLIFGETDFPKYIYKKIKGKKKYLIIDLTKKNIYKKDKYSYSVSIGQFGKIISILKSNNCKKVLFAGKVAKPNLKKIKLDLKGLYYIPKIIKSSKIGDAAILKQVINILRIEKIQTLKSNKFTPELSLKKGSYTKTKPNKADKNDINCAIKSLNSAGSFSHIQGAISRNNKVIRIEGKGGTKRMIKSLKKSSNELKGVLVKFPQKKQDLRIDLPTIGIDTLRQCKTAGLKGLVLKNKMNIVLDKKKCVKFANNNKMFILVR